MEAEGVAIIWVIEEINLGRDGLYEHCEEFNGLIGTDAGWCVGDGETMPEPGVFDNSPFSEARGFDILVDRSTMEVVLTTNHGTTSGNENITGEELLAEIRTFTQAR
ncbi:MAG: hypothetical protein EP330_16055 [Deltaproteobacteria bacterium]|nr:MAG: hypothetical protein EP330_16055 [Deltaproteobacteria bacterium]